MRRWGTIVMILGANLIVGSIAAAFYLASFHCALGEVSGACEQGAVSLFMQLMGSGRGLIYWTLIVIGALLLWRGWKIRAKESGG